MRHAPGSNTTIIVSHKLVSNRATSTSQVRTELVDRAPKTTPKIAPKSPAHHKVFSIQSLTPDIKPASNNNLVDRMAGIIRTLMDSVARLRTVIDLLKGDGRPPGDKRSDRAHTHARSPAGTMLALTTALPTSTIL